MAALRDDKRLTVMAASTSGAAFSGNDGEVCTVRIRTAPDMAEGDYPLLLSDVCISDANARSHNVAQLTTPLTINEASGIATVTSAKVRKAACHDLQGRRIDNHGQLRKGLYIYEGRKVVR